MNAPKNDQTFYGIQALRAIAALMVVLVHSIYLWHTRILHQPDPWYWMGGASGVDIFFVISGFVMTMSLPAISNFENRARVFLWRRITRIIPLYWLATTLKVVLLLAIPAAAMHPSLRLWNVIGSYLFVPTANPDGLIAPVIVQGWTLNFEMFFYLVFTCSLLVRLPTLTMLIPVLSLFAAIGLFLPLSTPPVLTLFSPLLVEFLFGVFIAQAVMKKRIPGAWISATLAVTGCVALLTIFPHLPQGSDEVQKWRFVLWGLPAAAIVLGTVGLEPILTAGLPKWVFETGNASYSVYLTQAFVLPVLGIIISRMAINKVAALILMVCMGMLISFLTGDVVHRFIERPILARLKRLNVSGVRAVSG
jgi:exopolysaccharide production protein ExoZ